MYVLKGQAVMANDSMPTGDLSSQVAQLNGKIKGNIEISGKIMLDRDSVIIGDIKAGFRSQYPTVRLSTALLLRLIFQRMKVPTSSPKISHSEIKHKNIEALHCGAFI